MKRENLGIMWGMLLIVAGLLALSQTFNFISTGTVWAVLWGIVFAIAGAGFIWWFLSDPEHVWWAAIPGMTLLAIAALIGFDQAGFADEQGAWLGGLFLGSIGLSFLLIYLVRRDFWWAIIPAGVLFTLAAVATLSTWISDEALGSVFFFGLALTFGLVYLLPTPHGRMSWALVPAGILAVMGVLVMAAFTSVVNYVWALLLIGAGVFLLFRQRGGGEMTRHS